MHTFTISFFGHSCKAYPEALEEELESLVGYLLMAHKSIKFLVGGNDDFDCIASSAIRRAKEKHGHKNAAHVLVLPYITDAYKNNEESFRRFYDEIEICSGNKMHSKSAIIKRNREMVDKSNIVLCYIEESHNGTINAVEYARSINKPVINIAETMQSKAEADNILREGAALLFSKGYSKDEVSDIILNYKLTLLCDDMTLEERRAFFDEKPVKPLRIFRNIE